MLKRDTRTQTGWLIRLIGGLLASLIAILLIHIAPTPQADAAGKGRHIGYGISVVPFVPSRPDLLDAMGMDWVKIYDTTQLGNYPGQHVLYRVNVPGNPNDYDGWEQGLTNLAHELADAGVDAVEIGNEPNLAAEWDKGHPMNPAQTADALCRGYRAFKLNAPQIIVVSGGIAPAASTTADVAIKDIDYVQAMFNAGADKCFDAFGYHPYGFNRAPDADPSGDQWVYRRTEIMHRWLESHGIYDRQMWLTEFGWVRDPAEDGMDCSKDPEFADFQWMIVSRDVQASYTARAFQIADSNWPFVGPMFLWNLNWNLSSDPTLGKCSHMRRYAILDNSGNPLPAFYAIQNLEKRAPVQYRPTVGALVSGGLSKTLEAGCTGQVRLGSFIVRNSGYPGHLDVDIFPANGPDMPQVWTSTQKAESGTTVEVYADATGLGPGIHMVAINLRAMGTQRMSTDIVRGWILIHYPTTPACVIAWDNGSHDIEPTELPTEAATLQP